MSGGGVAAEEERGFDRRTNGERLDDGHKLELQHGKHRRDAQRLRSLSRSGHLITSDWLGLRVSTTNCSVSKKKRRLPHDH